MTIHNSQFTIDQRITTHHAIPGEPDELTGELNMRMYFPQELDALLKYNGFTIEAKVDENLTSFGRESERQRIVCVRS